ncbi:RDD family protein [Agrococcus beijingensis]|uniref:RDD family protein n=1 Tax=Agrococcus beijingensis TaxID=3068634 RepID=UPI002741C97D|nr:RDD family protein [Agrococcus sp. REN33]
MIWEIDEGRKVVEGLDDHGRPDPAYAAALGLRPAPLGRRALASLIEFAFWALLQVPYWLLALPTLLKAATGAIQPYGLVTHPDFVWIVVGTAVSGVLSLAFVIVQLVLHGRKGVTLGKAFTGIRSIHVATLERPGIGKALLRGVLLHLGFLVPVVGPALLFSSVFFDGEQRGRGWLDKAAGTWFVDVRTGLDPYHEKKMRIARKTVQAEPEGSKSQLPSLATPADSQALGYRPGARISSGVVGAARPQQPAPGQVGLETHQPDPAPSHTVPGMPAGGARLGGYRPGQLSGLVDSVPGRERPAAPAEPQPAEERPAHDRPTQHGWQQAPPPLSSAPTYAPPPSPPRYAAAQASPVDEHTIVEPDGDDFAPADVAPSAATALPPAPQAGPAEEVDDSTVRRVEVAGLDDDLEATRARPGSRRVVATLAFDTGDRFAITGAALIGRNPSPSAGEVIEHLLPIADDTRSISKTHLLLTADPLAAIDRASTNGSSVVRAGAESRLAPGTPFALQPGDLVRFGDRSFQVEEAS